MGASAARRVRQSASDDRAGLAKRCREMPSTIYGRVSRSPPTAAANIRAAESISSEWLATAALMSKELLVAALRRAVAASPRPYTLTPGLARWADITPERVPELVHTLRTNAELRKIWGKWAALPDRGGTINPESAAVYLTGRARDGLGVETIVDSLLEFAETGQVDYISVRALTNVRIEARIDLGPGVYLASPAELPPWDARVVAFERGMAMGHGEALPPGLTALVVETRFSALHDAPPADLSLQTEPLLDPAVRTSISTAFERAHLALVAVGGVAPKYGVSYGGVPTPGWPGVDNVGAGGSIALPPAPPLIPLSKSSNLKSVYEKAENISPTIQLATKRLYSSYLRNSEEERAIDLGTCFEILLMHETKSANTEISNKLTHRGAWLIGTSGAERLEIAAKIKKIYGLRSKAVHEGKLPELATFEKVEERNRLFQECTAIIERLIIRLLEGWPDWSELTIGGRPD